MRGVALGGLVLACGGAAPRPEDSGAVGRLATPAPAETLVEEVVLPGRPGLAVRLPRGWTAEAMGNVAELRPGPGEQGDVLLVFSEHPADSEGVERHLVGSDGALAYFAATNRGVELDARGDLFVPSLPRPRHRAFVVRGQTMADDDIRLFLVAAFPVADRIYLAVATYRTEGARARAEPVVLAILQSLREG